MCSVKQNVASLGVRQRPGVFSHLCLFFECICCQVNFVLLGIRLVMYYDEVVMKSRGVVEAPPFDFEINYTD